MPSSIHVQEPLTEPLPPQTRYYHPFNPWQTRITYLACFSPAVWMIFETHPSLMAYELISAIVLTLIAIFAFNLMDPEHGTSHQRRLDTAFGPQIITVFRPYFGRKKCEVTGGIIEAAEPGKVVDLDASYGPCRRWGGTWDQRWEPALLVLDF